MKIAAVVAWLAVLALQVSLWPQITPRVLPAFALAAAVAWGVLVNVRTGWWLAIGSGAVLDLYAQHDFGMLTLASALAYGGAWLLMRGYTTGTLSWGPVLAAAAAAAGVYELVVLIWTMFSVDRFPFFAELFGTGTLNALATVVAFLITAGLISLLLSRLNLRHEGPLRN